MSQAVSEKPRRKFFYGWFVVLGGFICQMITGINSQGFSTYFPLLEAEFGWSKTLLSAPRSLSQVETAILGPINGYLTDKLGPRVLVALGVFLFGLGLVLFGFVHQVWSFIAVFAIMAVGGSFSSLLVVSTAINNWFRRKRTLGIGLATTGLGVSGVISIPLIVLAQDAYGWRTAAIISGVAVWVIGLPAAAMMRTNPEKYGLLPDGDPPGTEAQPGRRRGHGGSPGDFTLGEAIRTPAFWLISVGVALGQFAMSAISVHQFSQMESEVGLTRAAAASVVVVMSAFNIGGRLFGGFLGDRISKRLLLGIALFGSGIAILIVALAHNFVQAMIFGIIYGTSWGIRTPLNNSIRGEYFGRTHYGRIGGISQGISSPFAIGGPILMGFLADVQGQYHLTFILMGVVSLAASVMLLLAAPPPPPKRAEAAGRAAH